MKGILCQLYFVLVVIVSKSFMCSGHEEFLNVSNAEELKKKVILELATPG